jgi:hypothetical protein
VKAELPLPSAQATPLRLHLSAIQKDSQQSLHSMGRFIVFKVDGSSPTLPGRVLKSYEVTDGLLALSLPEDSSDAIKGFFFDKTARLGLSSESGAPTALSVAGIFSAREAAVKNFPSLAKIKWYTPPPQELLTLGTGAWTKQ